MKPTGSKPNLPASRQRRLNSVVADATRRAFLPYPALKRRANLNRRSATKNKLSSYEMSLGTRWKLRVPGLLSPNAVRFGINCAASDREIAEPRLKHLSFVAARHELQNDCFGFAVLQGSSARQSQ